MRIRPAYIVVFILLVIGGFILYAALSNPATGTDSRGASPAPSTGPGILPPVDQAQDQVAHLEVETDTFDMGTVPNHEPTTKPITVRNTGQKTLEVKDITTTCACTTGKITPEQIRPGGEATLEVTVYPNRVPGFYSKKRLTIMSNAPNAPMQNIDVTAHIEPEFSVEPEELDFGEVQKGQKAQRQVLFRQVGGEPIEVLDVRPMDEAEKGVSFEYARRPESAWQEPGKAEYEIVATLEPWAPIGEYSQAYEIITSCKRVPRYRQKFTATVHGFYELSQDRVFFTMRPGMTTDKPLGELVVQADRPIEIVDAQVTGEDFIVKTTPGPEANTATLEVYTTEKATVGRKDEELSFYVTAEDSEPLPNVVPVRGVVIDVQ